MTMNTATNATPFPRADYKAKSHPRPKPKVHYRRAVRRERMEVVL
jgi:hypothetical protein